MATNDKRAKEKKKARMVSARKMADTILEEKVGA